MWKIDKKILIWPDNQLCLARAGKRGKKENLNQIEKNMHE